MGIDRSSSQRPAAGSGNNVPLFHQAPASTMVQGGNGSTGSFLPIIHAQIKNGSSQQQPNSTDLLLQMNHNLVMKLPGCIVSYSTSCIYLSIYLVCTVFFFLATYFLTIKNMVIVLQFKLK